MPFGFSARGRELYDKVSAFIGAHIIPNEFAWEAALAANTAAGQRWTPIPMIEELKAKARAQGLWNLFSPDPEHGPGLSNLDYAPIAELTGRNPWAAEVFNCSAPDSGNMEILARFGTADQKARWLAPLLAGEIRSCFAMTEPDSGSDAYNMRTTATPDGDGKTWRVSGRKAGVVNAMGDFFTVFARTAGVDPASGSAADQLTAFAVERAAGGVSHGAPEQVLGVRCSSAAEVHFEATAAPAGSVAARGLLATGDACC
jgi:alkylation response protein AidB-like acyl-CoA dehydrogenase